jgi:DNA-binding NarL/FixJ family response regulator
LILGLHVVVFAVKECVESVLVWAEAGVAGYIPSTAAMAEFQALLADVRAGRQTCSPMVAAGLLQGVASAALGTMQLKNATPVLSPRELEIVRLIGSGSAIKRLPATSTSVSPRSSRMSITYSVS